MSLENQAVVVTGAARGIGWEMVKRLLEEGARVALLDADGAALAEVSATLPSDRVLTVVTDVGREDDVRTATEEVVETWGGFDGWINNAGLARHRWITDYTEEEIDLMLAVNLKGTILGSQAALRHLSGKGRGHILNVISTASLRGIPSESVYCAAKWGVRGFTQGLAEEAAAKGIKVTALLPGGVDTAFWDDASDREMPTELFLTARQVAESAIQCLKMSGNAVPRELVLRAIGDRDFAGQED